MSKKINAKKFAQVLVETVEGKTEKEMEKTVSEFVTYLAERRLLAYWREIVRSMDSVWQKKYGVANVTITSAHALSEKSRKALQKAVAGAEVIEMVDPELIGGAIVRIDDRIFDSSVLGTLNSLKNSLIK